MSGGHFNYAQYHIHDIVEEIEDLIKTNESEELDCFGEKIGRFYNKETIQRFKEATRLLRLSEIYVNSIDLLVCGDDGEENFHKHLQEYKDKYYEERLRDED